MRFDIMLTMLIMCLSDVAAMCFISASVKPHARIFSGSRYVTSCVSYVSDQSVSI